MDAQPQAEPTTVSGTLVDPIQKTSFGARLTVSGAGRIEAITPDDNPGPLYILPGLVDAHVHIESTLLNPVEFARASVVHGVLSAVTDMRGLSNVLGEEAAALMLALAAQTPFVFGFGARSGAPATPSESSTDHESATFDEAREKIKAGVKIQIRHGSATPRFEALLPLLARYPGMCMFCSDYKAPDALLRSHVNHIAATAYRKGISLQAVLQAASVNPVLHYKLPLGLLQPGDTADFILLDDFDTFAPREVWLRGRCVARDGQPLLPRGAPCAQNRFAAGLLNPEALRVPAPEGRAMRAIRVRDEQPAAECVIEEIRVRDGCAAADAARDLAKLVVCNRYAPAQPAVGFVTGFGLSRGALASSVSHDSHHIVAIGATDEALAAAINEVVMRQGGLVVADNNRKILAALPLPFAGLMSNEPADVVARAYRDCNGLAQILGSRLIDPFMTLMRFASSALPHSRLADQGLFDCDAPQPAPLFTD